jgi:hypothetical protein
LQQAKKELNKKTDIAFTYKENKTGRKIGDSGNSENAQEIEEEPEL